MKQPMPETGDDFYIENSDERLFKSWATVEIRDKQGEIIPMGEFKKSMFKYFMRGAPLTLEHSDKVVGKLINYEFKENPRWGKEGCYVTGLIYNDYDIDTQVWKDIQSGKIKGLSVGGKYAVQGGTAVWLNPMSFALGNPANPAAQIIVKALAKTDGEFSKEAQEHPALPPETVKQIVADHAKKGDSVPDEKPEEKKAEKVEEKPVEKATPTCAEKTEPQKEEAKKALPTEPAPKEEEAVKATPAPEVPAEKAEEHKEPDGDEMKTLVKSLYKMVEEMHKSVMKANEQAAAAEAAKATATPEAPVEKTVAKTANDAILKDLKKSLGLMTEVPRPETAMPFTPQNETPNKNDAVKIAMGQKKYNPREVELPSAFMGGGNSG